VQPFNFTEDNNLLLFSSQPKATPLAQEWNFTMWKYNNLNVLLTQDIKRFLLSIKEEILTKHKPLDAGLWNDGGTGLGNDSLTARYASYNLLKFEDPCIKKFKSLIKNQLKLYINKINITITKPLYINCWYNVLEPGESLSPHNHTTSFHSFLSGHFTVACEESSTYYHMPYGDGLADIPNFTGAGIFFPSYLSHGTTPHKGVNPRITIAFDIFYGDECVSPALKDNVILLNLEEK
jgi:hypothetical protein